MTPINQDIEAILTSFENPDSSVAGGWSYDFQKMAKWVAQRERDLIEYIATLYGLPADELKRNIELWRGEK